jgi:hypothetical protein
MRSFLVRLGTLTITGMLAGGLALAASGPAAAAGNPNGTGQAEFGEDGSDVGFNGFR